MTNSHDAELAKAYDSRVIYAACYQLTESSDIELSIAADIKFLRRGAAQSKTGAATAL